MSPTSRLNRQRLSPGQHRRNRLTHRVGQVSHCLNRSRAHPPAGGLPVVLRRCTRPQAAATHFPRGNMPAVPVPGYNVAGRSQSDRQAHKTGLSHPNLAVWLWAQHDYDSEPPRGSNFRRGSISRVGSISYSSLEYASQALVIGWPISDSRSLDFSRHGYRSAWDSRSSPFVRSRLRVLCFQIGRLAPHAATAQQSRAGERGERVHDLRPASPCYF